MPLSQVGGFVLALTAMTLYGVYMVPRRSSGVSHEVYSFWMGAGILGSTLVIGLIDSRVLHVGAAMYWVIVGSGVLWGTGALGYTRAVQIIGLSRSTPVKNLSAAFGALLGVFGLHEFSERGWVPVVCVIGGSVAVMVSAAFLGRAEAPADSDAPRPGPRKLAYGFVCALWAAVAYTLYTIPMKMAYAQGVTPVGFLFYMGQGCFLGMALPLVFRGRSVKREAVSWRERGMAMSSGGMFGVGLLCANVAVKLIGVAVTWPLTKTTLVAALYGAFMLKEVDMDRHRSDFVMGVGFSVLGVVALAVATAHA